MNFSFYIAKRYLFSKSSNANAINIITLIAMFGVIVGALALFIILSGFSGLRTFNTDLFNASDPDIKITYVKGKTLFFTSAVKKVLDNTPDVLQYSKVIEERVFLKNAAKSHIANIKGVDNNYLNTVAIDSSISLGGWIDPKYKNTAVAGAGILYKLSLGILSFDETLEIQVPKPGKGFVNPNNAFRSVKVQIIGMYQGNEDFQNKYVFTQLSLAQELLNYKKNQISAISLKLADPENAVDVKNELQEKLGANFQVRTREQLNSLHYKVVNTENFVSYLIFTLIVVIALFNVIGAVIMMLIDKRSNLKTLLNLGANIKQIKKIFVLQGFLLTLVGMTIGLTIGILLVIIQQQFSLFMITESIAYPVEFRWANLSIVMATIVILGYIASKIASARISEKFILK